MAQYWWFKTAYYMCPYVDGSCIIKSPRIFLEADELSIFMLGIPSLMVNWKTSFQVRWDFTLIYVRMKSVKIFLQHTPGGWIWVFYIIVHTHFRRKSFIYFSKHHLYDSEQFSQVISVYLVVSISVAAAPKLIIRGCELRYGPLGMHHFPYAWLILWTLVSLYFYPCQP